MPDETVSLFPGLSSLEGFGPQCRTCPAVAFGLDVEQLWKREARSEDLDWRRLYLEEHHRRVVVECQLQDSALRLEETARRDRLALAEVKGD